MIRITGLNKFYKKKQVLHDICMELDGGVVGVLGPNGAGKTTLFRCMIGTTDYQGKIEKSGNMRIGYLPQNFDCFHELTVSEAMEYLALLKHTDVSENSKLLKQVELLQEKDIKVKKLSGGMKRRLGVAQAMMGCPELVLMDEPTAGLDPESRLQVRNLIAEFGGDTTIMVSSHIAQDLDAVADQIVFLHDGRIRYNGTKQEIMNRMAGRVAEVAMTREEFKKSNFLYTSVRSENEQMVVRLVGEDVPGANLVPPTLEDAYFYFEGQKDE
jgi:ABC-2 type transport system ATP-binding protein